MKKKIVVSNRLPFSYDKESGTLIQSTGGLVSALTGVRSEVPFDWFGLETNTEVAEKYPSGPSSFKCHPVIVDADLYSKYYDGMCNDVLWPIFHYEPNVVEFQKENWQAYLKVNEIVAEEILKFSDEEDLIWVHDYHFLMVGYFIKQKRPKMKIGFFLHIPFPSSELFKHLAVREELLKGLISYDLIGFHEYSYLRHFTVALKAFLGLESSAFSTHSKSSEVCLGVYPISIEAGHFKDLASTSSVLSRMQSYEEKIPEPFVILGVDRLDYSKGLLLKLKGFRLALKQHPELLGKITLLQIAVPTRTTVPAYVRLKTEIDQLISEINGRYGKPDYTPVRYMFQSVSKVELVALYRFADVILVTSKRDGMNLVCLEYIACQDPTDPGSVILSEFAGASSLLGDAILINPWDATAISDSIHQSFQMKKEERIQRFQGSNEVISKYSSTSWANSFLTDLGRWTDSRSKRAESPLILASDVSMWHQDLIDSIVGRQLLIAIDYDGTLVPFENHPQDAVLPERTKRLLEKLARQPEIHVCIVSGRPRKFLGAQFSGLPLSLCAEHGAFYKLKDQEDWKNPVNLDTSSWYPAVAKVMNDYADRVPMSFLESKEASLVWHYRKSPPGFATYQARKLAEELEVLMANLPVSVLIGSKNVEARSLECNKGQIVRLIAEGLPPQTRVICIGDDRTDEDMFKVLPSEITIKVGQDITSANHRFPRCEDVLIFLESLEKFVSEYKNQRAPVGKAI